MLEFQQKCSDAIDAAFRGDKEGTTVHLNAAHQLAQQAARLATRRLELGAAEAFSLTFYHTVRRCLCYLKLDPTFRPFCLDLTPVPCGLGPRPPLSDKSSLTRRWGPSEKEPLLPRVWREPGRNSPREPVGLRTACKILWLMPSSLEIASATATGGKLAPVSAMMMSPTSTRIAHTPVRSGTCTNRSSAPECIAWTAASKRSRLAIALGRGIRRS